MLILIIELDPILSQLSNLSKISPLTIIKWLSVFINLGEAILHSIGRAKLSQFEKCTPRV